MQSSMSPKPNSIPGPSESTGIQAINKAEKKVEAQEDSNADKTSDRKMTLIALEGNLLMTVKETTEAKGTRGIERDSTETGKGTIDEEIGSMEESRGPATVSVTIVSRKMKVIDC